MPPASRSELQVLIEHSVLDPATPLGDDVLAAVVFGSETPCPADPRCVRVDLAPLQSAPYAEIWRAPGRVRRGTHGPIRYTEHEQCLAGCIEVEEDRFGGLAEAAEYAYAQLLDFHAESTHPYIWRIWNFITDVNEGTGDDERYRLFCLGRARGFARSVGSGGSGFPAATAVGKRRGDRTLQICWMAGRTPGTAIENPRQLSAYLYPRKYGPEAPRFCRAMLLPGPKLLVSGTASIAGHESVHEDDLGAQLAETILNLESLQDPLLSQRQTDAGALVQTLVKVYLRNRADAAFVEGALHSRLGSDARIIVLEADICRSELLLEIESITKPQLSD
jgi:chorismate lyase/3-hydroxybenzoate synthase